MNIMNIISSLIKQQYHEITMTIKEKDDPYEDIEYVKNEYVDKLTNQLRQIGWKHHRGNIYNFNGDRIGDTHTFLKDDESLIELSVYRKAEKQRLEVYKKWEWD